MSDISNILRGQPGLAGLVAADHIEAQDAELKELRLAYAECSRQKNELLTAHKLSAQQIRVLREALRAIKDNPSRPEPIYTLARAAPEAT